MADHVRPCATCGNMCFARSGEISYCPDCYVPENPTFGWKIRRWIETKGGKPSDLQKFSTTSQKEKFLNSVLGITIKKTKPKEENNDR